MKKQIVLCLFFLLPFYLFSQIQVVFHKEKDNLFPLVEQQKVQNIFVDKNDHEVVNKVALLLAEDIKLVSNVKPQILTANNIKAKKAVIIGTIGKNSQIDKLIAEKKIDVSSIKGEWERYMIQRVLNPFSGVDEALVIVGSDRRGTAYGVFSLSEAIGVSPLYWWADVPVVKRDEIYIDSESYISKAPSVKYRGIFINDEGWGITPWAAKTFDPQLNDIGPKTYEKVCELILRMKGNMLAPAMHPASGAFNKHADNKVVADSYGIIMTSSHCEPLLYNNTTEWDAKKEGDWNYATNKEGIMKVLDKRVSENSPYENIYTIAMRGVHDAGIVGIPKEKHVEVLETVMCDQRGLLSKHIENPIEEIPQIFVPYKEVLDIYEKGLNVPEDITIVWPDDNYGYMKKLSNKAEQNRKGGSGIYYHISYLGEPHDYLWLNTTPPALMFEELKKAYDTGADRYWLLNVGDIKPGELGMKLFLDMAWDMEKFNFENINDYQVDFLSSVFGSQFRTDINDILSSYYQLAFQRKPEAMGWGWEWNSRHEVEQIFDTEFSFTNYNEAEDRIEEYDRIARKSESILNQLPKDYQPAFFQLLHYSVKGAELMNKKMLVAQQNRWYATQGRSATNSLAKKVQLYYDSINQITDQYNNLLDGKWKHMMSLPPGWTARYQNMPPVKTIDLSNKSRVGLFLSNEDLGYGGINIKALPCFNPYTQKTYFFELYNKGRNSVKWSASTKSDWVIVSSTEGEFQEQERIYVSVDWSKAPKGEKHLEEITIDVSGQKETVYVSLFNPETPSLASLKGLYVEDNGYVSIDAAGFHRKKENGEVKVKVIDGLGYENEVIQLGEGTQNTQNMWMLDGTQVEYDFYAFNTGVAKIYTYALPLFPIDTESETRYGVKLNDGMVMWPSTASKEYSSPWRENVIRNSTINVTTVNIDKVGKQTLSIFCGDPGMLIQKIVIDMGGLKRTYLGPKPTKVKEKY